FPGVTENEVYAAELCLCLPIVAIEFIYVVSSWLRPILASFSPLQNVGPIIIYIGLWQLIFNGMGDWLALQLYRGTPSSLWGRSIQYIPGAYPLALELA